MAEYVALCEHPKRDAWFAAAPDMLARVLLRSNKGWARTVDTQAAVKVVSGLVQDYEHAGLSAAVLHDSHLLIYSVGSPWYAPTEKLIIEQFFVRVDKGSTEEALAALDLLAKDLGATGVVMATSLAANDKALGRLLGRFGYTSMSSQHWRDIA